MRTTKSLVQFLLILLVSVPVFAQDTLNTLDDKWDFLLNSSETYESYKVIRAAKLGDFWAQVQDTIRENNRTISQLSNQVDEQSAEISSRDSRIGDLEASLDESNTMNDSITFLGATFSKSVYHVIVWGIIFILIAGLLVILTLYQRSHSLTSRAQKEFQQVNDEFVEFKNRSREKEVKLKRELQTAVNNLEEARRGRSI